MTEQVRLWIGGEWVGAEDGATFDATSPSTGEVIAAVAEGSRADARRGVATAAAPAARSSAFVGRPRCACRGVDR
jgi:succinate-semialdehyde dehydrogenase/glutarate-semialdehyde dehydrogenase